MKVVASGLAATLALGACDAVTKTTAAAVPLEATAQAAPLTASGPAVPVAAEDPTDENLQYSAGVVQLDPLPDQNAKLFGTAGGDPAMNGLYTYIAFYASPADGWAIYRLGDFLDYTIVSSAPGRVDLDIHESTIDEASGNIGDRHRKVIVSWTPGADDGPPGAVTVTPAE